MNIYELSSLFGNLNSSILLIFYFYINHFKINGNKPTILKVQASENVVVLTLWKKGMFENHRYLASE